MLFQKLRSALKTTLAEARIGAAFSTARFRAATLLLAALLAPALAPATPPPILSYQGYLTSDQGDPLPGPVELEFALYDSIAGGTELWMESHPAVPLTDGIFHLALGATTPLDAAFFEGSGRWLETRLDGTPLSPRRPLLSVPYALRAAVADVALSGGGGEGDWEGSNGNVYRLSGDVGVGTSSPTEPLHVVDPLFARLRLERTGGSVITADASLTSASIGTTSSHPFRLVTNNSVRMTLDTAGNVGIGTISPTANLQVNGTGARAIYGLQSGAAGSLVGVFGETNSITGTGVRGQANHATGVTMGVHGQATGAAGIGVLGEALGNGSLAQGVRGTSSSSTGAGVYGHAAALSGVNYGVYARTGSSSGYGLYALNTSGGAAAYLEGDATTTGTHRFGTTNETALDGNSLMASHELLLESGADMTIDSNLDLTVSSSRDIAVNAVGALQLDADSGLTLLGGPSIALGASTFTSAADSHRFTGNVGLGMNPVFQLQLSLNSAAKPTSSSWTIASDRRLKKEIRVIEGALDKLLRLRGVTYRWIDPASQGGMDGEYMGLIAQEVAEVFPEWVGTDANGYHNVTVSGFEGLVAESLRQLRDEHARRMEELEARCRRLEARIEELGGDHATR